MLSPVFVKLLACSLHILAFFVNTLGYDRVTYLFQSVFASFSATSTSGLHESADHHAWRVNVQGTHCSNQVPDNKHKQQSCTGQPRDKVSQRTHYKLQTLLTIMLKSLDRFVRLECEGHREDDIRFVDFADRVNPFELVAEGKLHKLRGVFGPRIGSGG